MPYILFVSLFLLAMIIGVSITLLYIDFIGWFGERSAPYFRNYTRDCRGTGRDESYPCVHLIVFLKHIYYSSYLLDIWRFIISTIQHWISKAHIYKKCKNQENKANNKNNNRDFKRYYHY